MSLICVQNFTKKYGDREVVKNISFTAKDGAITGFIRHNGAGKSTTIKAITGVIRPTEGKHFGGDTVVLCRPLHFP